MSGLLKCAFCQMDQSQVKKLVAGPADIYICSRCVDKCHDLLIKNDAEEAADITEGEDATEEESDVTPREIKGFLDQYIIGQDDAKTIISVAAYNHYKRLEHDETYGRRRRRTRQVQHPPAWVRQARARHSLPRPLRASLKCPCVVCDATSLTEAGYVGDDVESVVGRLLNAARGDVGLCERGIVFIDEIDKKKSQKSASPLPATSPEKVCSRHCSACSKAPKSR
jgi:ATP-dependent Clp protease ATP-binding subunit ClpX